MKKILSLILSAAVLLAVASCTGEGDGPDMPPDGPTPQIIFLFSPGGLGDLSYNDCILEGVQRFKKAHRDVDLFLYSPPDLATAERIFSDWVVRPESDIPVVFVLASSDYESLVETRLADMPPADNKRILLFESLREFDDERVSTFQVSMYGASVLAGVTAAECGVPLPALVLLGSSTDVPTESARDGFMAGYGPCDVEYMAADWSGYVMADAAYRRMGEWASRYGFIFPVAGGTNAGIYRYSREYEDCPLLAGMDTDQWPLSAKITGSVVKRLDLLVDEYLTRWVAEGSMPRFRLYGLESGYVDWVLSPLYQAQFHTLTERARPEAVEKEKEYYAID